VAIVEIQRRLVSVDYRDMVLHQLSGSHPSGSLGMPPAPAPSYQAPSSQAVRHQATSRAGGRVAGLSRPSSSLRADACVPLPSDVPIATGPLRPPARHDILSPLQAVQQLVGGLRPSTLSCVPPSNLPQEPEDAPPQASSFSSFPPCSNPPYTLNMQEPPCATQAVSQACVDVLQRPDVPPSANFLHYLPQPPVPHVHAPLTPHPTPSRSHKKARTCQGPPPGRPASPDVEYVSTTAAAGAAPAPVVPVCLYTKYTTPASSTVGSACAAPPSMSCPTIVTSSVISSTAPTTPPAPCHPPTPSTPIPIPSVGRHSLPSSAEAACLLAIAPTYMIRRAIRGIEAGPPAPPTPTIVPSAPTPSISRIPCPIPQPPAGSSLRRRSPDGAASAFHVVPNSSAPVTIPDDEDL
jgi:hypothetical protein